MAWAMVWPCAGPSASVLSTRTSSVPWSMSPSMGGVPRLGMLQKIILWRDPCQHVPDAGGRTAGPDGPATFVGRVLGPGTSPRLGEQVIAAARGERHHRQRRVLVA